MSEPIDTHILRNAIRDFQFHSTPNNADRSAPCTVGDIRKVIDNLSKLMNTFVDEIDNAQ